MAEVESHSNGNGKHTLDDDSVDSPVKAKLLKAENGDAVVKQAAVKTNLKDDDTSAAESTPAVDEEKSVEASNDSNGVIDVAALQAGDQSNNKSDFNESESCAVSTGGVGDESNTNTNDLGITSSSTNDLRNENTNESNGDDLVVSGGRRRVKEVSDNSGDNYEDDEDDEDDDVGPSGEDDEGGEDEDDDDGVDEEDEDDEGDDGEEDEEDGGEE